MNKNNKNPTSILSYLFIFLLTSVSTPYCELNNEINLIDDQYSSNEEVL